MTVPAAVLALTVTLAVGFGAGWLARSAWILLVAPVTFMVVFELARLRVEGPTVDDIDLESGHFANLMSSILGPLFLGLIGSRSS